MQWIKDIILILYPEILVLFALIIAVFFSTSKLSKYLWTFSALLMFIGCVHIIKFQWYLKDSFSILNGMFIADKLSIIFRLLALVVGILIVLGSMKYSEGFTHRNEFIIILLCSILGVMILAGTNDLITLFVALETLSLSSIMLTGYSKYDTRSNEAALKYLLNSASASAIFLFGLSLLYGLSGSTQFDEIKYRLWTLSSEGTLNYSVLTVIVMLIIGGLAFKLASAPLHMWSPDVYEGAPTPTTAFLSVGSKIAAFAITLRILFNLFGNFSGIWQPIIITISVLSMLIGNYVALGEVLNKASIKRFMAYSSIAQIGYVLIGLSLAKSATVSASIFYLIIYSIMNLGAFLCIIAFGNEANSDSISSYSGLAKKRPLLAFAFAVCLFNLAGLPIPPAGFIAKFILFKASFESGLVGIVIGSIALLTTILSVFYYLYIAKLMIVDKPSEAVMTMDSNKDSIGKSIELNFAISLAVTAIFMLTILSNKVLNVSNLTGTYLSNKNIYVTKHTNSSSLTYLTKP